MIRRFYNKKQRPKFYRLLISAPDGRFGLKTLVGGIDKNLMEHEAKRYNELGMIIDIFPETNS